MEQRWTLSWFISHQPYETLIPFSLFLDIPLNTTAEEMQVILQENFDVGTVVVTKTAKCYYSKWKISWVSKPGKQPPLRVNTTKLSGNRISFKNSQTEGGLFYNKIPAEFLRMPTENPQVIYLDLKKKKKKEHTTV